MDIPIYKNKLPEIDENVLVIFTEYKDTHIEAELVEYCSLKGMMIYEDATRKKKVYDWKKEVPLNKVIVAKVEEIFSDTYVKLSTGYFDQKLDSTELRKKLMKPFSDNKVLTITIKKICKNNNLDFNAFWSNIIYKINDIKRSDELNDSLLDYISDNKELFNNIIKENYLENYEKIIDEYEKQISNKIFKIQSKFSLITKHSIENSKELLKLSCDNNKDWSFTLKYETTPTFILESSSENSTQENHESFLTFLEENSKIFNVNYVKIN
jgi:translation initiation factor 2 alpha subunit (eIF-2alpha)